MIVTILAAFLLPIAVALALGTWQGKRPASTPGEFVKHIGTATLFAACIIFLIQMVITGALLSGTQGSMAGLGKEAWRATFMSGLFWLPTLVIAYIVRATKEKRS